MTSGMERKDLCRISHCNGCDGDVCCPSKKRSNPPYLMAMWHSKTAWLGTCQIQVIAPFPQ